MRKSVLAPSLAALSISVLSISALSLGACSTVVETVQGPQLAPIGYPAQLVPVTQSYMATPQPRSASANSLWRTGARAFFGDQRARNIGDIVTVNIHIRREQSTSTESKSVSLLAHNQSRRECTGNKPEAPPQHWDTDPRLR